MEGLPGAVGRACGCVLMRAGKAGDRGSLSTRLGPLDPIHAKTVKTRLTIIASKEPKGLQGYLAHEKPPPPRTLQ